MDGAGQQGQGFVVGVAVAVEAEVLQARVAAEVGQGIKGEAAVAQVQMGHVGQPFRDWIEVGLGEYLARLDEAAAVVQDQVPAAVANGGEIGGPVFPGGRAQLFHRPELDPHSSRIGQQHAPRRNLAVEKVNGAAPDFLAGLQVDQLLVNAVVQRQVFLVRRELEAADAEPHVQQSVLARVPLDRVEFGFLGSVIGLSTHDHPAVVGADSELAAAQLGYHAFHLAGGEVPDINGFGALVLGTVKGTMAMDECVAARRHGPEGVFLAADVELLSFPGGGVPGEQGEIVGDELRVGHGGQRGAVGREGDVPGHAGGAIGSAHPFAGADIEDVDAALLGVAAGDEPAVVRKDQDLAAKITARNPRQAADFLAGDEIDQGDAAGHPGGQDPACRRERQRPLPYRMGSSARS